MPDPNTDPEGSMLNYIKLMINDRVTCLFVTMLRLIGRGNNTLEVN